MLRRSFLTGASMLIGGAMSGQALAGDRVTGAAFASRSVVYSRHGTAATAHPLATLIGIGILRRGGSAIDAAIGINAALGFLEPVSCGMGGDCFLMVWDPTTHKVMGFNGSGRSPRGMSLDFVKSKAKNNHIPAFGIASVNVPGAVDTWGQVHAKFGKTPLADILAPAIAIAREGVPVAQTIAYYIGASVRRFSRPDSGIEETANFLKIYAPNGAAPKEGELFRNPDMADTLETIAKGGTRAFYEGEIAERIETYFKRIGGFMTKADLAAHHGEWVEPIATTYRGIEVLGLPPNSQGLSTLQLLNILENFDLKGMGFQSVQSIHTQVEAKRLAFEDRARYFADPDFAKTPVAALLSKDYAKTLAAKIRPDRILDRAVPYEAPTHGDTTYFTVADNDGMMVSWIQSNYRGMGSGLIADGLGFMFQDRGELFSLKPNSPNVYAPGKRPFHTIIPGFALKDGNPWLSFGVMGGDMQPQGQAQIIINLTDYGLGLQEAGDAARWHHEGSSEPTGETAEGTGLLRLESGVPDAIKAGLAALGWKLGASDGGFGGYQAIERKPGPDLIYGAASEMRKDGLALGY